MTQVAFDVLVIGSGPAGVSCALPLLAAGHKVLMIDGGNQPEIPVPRLPFLVARTSDSSQWKWMIGPHYEALQASDAVSPKLKAPPLGYVFKDFSSVNRIESNEFLVAGSLATGGLSNAWGAGVACLSNDELSDFPFPSSQIHASYAAVAKRIGISGRADDNLADYFGVDQWAQPPIPLDALHTRLYRRHLRRAGEPGGGDFRFGRSRVAVLSADLAERKGCDRSGNCLWGCDRRSIYSAADELGVLRRYENFTHEAGFTAQSLARQEGAWSVRGLHRPSGETRAATAHKVVLAAGTLASTRLALLALGRTTPVRLLSCPTAAFLLWLPQALGRQHEAAFGLGQLSFSLTTSTGVPAFGSTFATTGIPVSEFARFLPLRRRYAIDLLASLLSSCLVGNLFMPGTLSANTAHVTNQGDLKITGAFDDSVPELMADAKRRLGSHYRRLGATMLPLSFTMGRPGSDIHYAGTLPMRAQPIPGECYPSGELHGLAGVYVVDGASLPTLSEKSHTLTIMANSDRIGRSLALEMQARLASR